jgi:hypothetical protein
MPFRFQLSDARNDLGIKSISGVCGSSAQLAQYVNEAQRRLMRRGNWYDTEWVVSFCVSGNIIAWPRWVGSVNGIRFGKGRPGQLFNNNYSFVGPHLRHSGFHCDTVIEDANMGPCANEVSGTAGKLIRYYVVNPADVGKTITLYGSQYGAQPLQDSTGAAGLSLTAANPYGASTTLVTRIDSVVRQATIGMAYLYEFDPTANTLRDLAAFEPGETNPRIRRSIIHNKPYNRDQADANGICWTTMEALIKLEFIPVVNDRDFLMIDNLDAIKFMIQAIKAEEANDEQTAELKISKAIRELNFDLRDKNGDDQMPIRVNSVLGSRIRNPY